MRPATVCHLHGGYDCVQSLWRRRCRMRLLGSPATCGKGRSRDKEARRGASLSLLLAFAKSPGDWNSHIQHARRVAIYFLTSLEPKLHADSMQKRV